MDTFIRRSSSVLLFCAAAAALAVALTGCAEQQYQTIASLEQKEAPGAFVMPPRVDILLAEDDTGSIKEIYEPISAQMPKFLQELEAKGWDYHFMTAPLTTVRQISQIVGSKYDSNWGSAWLPPYPGAVQHAPDSGTIEFNLFRKLTEYTGFLSYSDTSNGLNGLEPGFETIHRTLRDEAPGTGFLRDDALLVILVVGNGNDTSGVTMCTRSDGYTGPCEDLGYASRGTAASSFESYRQKFLDIKQGVSSLIKFYAAVAPRTQCLSQRAIPGTRYMDMATQLGGQKYDICTQPVSSVLAGMAEHLQTQRIGFRTRYLFIAQEPDVATIEVTRFKNGDPNQSEIIPQDATNGWTYAGYQTDVFAIDFPTPMNQASGYAIELHGSARLVGNDTASVQFKPSLVAPQ